MSVFGKWFAGSTGDPPVPSGDSPDGTGATVRANGHGLFATLLAAVLAGRLPTRAGGSPAPPIFKAGSETALLLNRVRSESSVGIEIRALSVFGLQAGRRLTAERGQRRNSAKGS